MRYITAAYTDIGTKKQTNQDSMLIMQAETDRGRVLLASVCDGMGGLAKGEVASATMIRRLSQWFSRRLPVLIRDGFDPDRLWADWTELVDDTNRSIIHYGVDHHANLGTTAAVMLIVGDSYYLLNVGDSRIYWLSDALYQLTKDHSVIQQEMDAGRLTPEQAMTDPRRSILTQCVGSSDEVHPDYGVGAVRAGDEFLLCTDGFRHAISPQEIYEAFLPQHMNSSEIMRQKLKEMTELNIARNENDNISALLVKCCD